MNGTRASSLQKVFNLLSDGQHHTTRELREVAGDGADRRARELREAPYFLAVHTVKFNGARGYLMMLPPAERLQEVRRALGFPVPDVNA